MAWRTNFGVHYPAGTRGDTVLIRFFPPATFENQEHARLATALMSLWFKKDQEETRRLLREELVEVQPMKGPLDFPFEVVWES